MAAALLSGATLSDGLTRRNIQWCMMKRTTDSYCLKPSCESCNVSMLRFQKGFFGEDACSHWSTAKTKLFSPVAIRKRKPFLKVLSSQLSSDYGLASCDEANETALEKQGYINSSEIEVCESTFLPTHQSHAHNVKNELIMLSLPAIAGQALDPFAQLMETAYIGPVELASAGVSISIFNIISKLFNMPLLSVATSFVAEEISETAKESSALNGVYPASENERKQLSSVSTALLLSVAIGIFEALALVLGSGIFLDSMGISRDSPMRTPAERFLSLRALGAPAVVVSLALQGVLRGFKDTKTPVFCLGVGNIAAVFLFPLLIYYFQLGLTGAAISTIVSQYIVAFLMIWFLNKRAVLLPPKLGDLQFGVYMKSGGFLLGRTLAVLMTMTIGTSMAARQGPLAMAAHQICLQVWLAVSLLTDALASSGQALIAGSLSKGDYRTVKEITHFVLKVGVLTGASLAAILGVCFGSLATFFTKDMELLQVVKTGVLFVSASQPVNALAFIFDGLHYGVSDFAYAAFSMMVVGAISSAFLLYAPPVIGLRGVWLGLTLFMALRMVAGFVRLLSENGPWWFLHRESPVIKIDYCRPWTSRGDNLSAVAACSYTSKLKSHLKVEMQVYRLSLRSPNSQPF
ncbi:Protein DETOXIFICATION 45, chloroplastic [Ancistrocladus abbreviatus]